jgi:hypothetical protein
MARLIKFNNSNVNNSERGSVACAEPGYGLVRIPVEERQKLLELYLHSQCMSS